MLKLHVVCYHGHRNKMVYLPVFAKLCQRAIAEVMLHATSMSSDIRDHHKLYLLYNAISAAQGENAE